MRKFVEIERVHAREIMGAFGFPTVEVEVRTEEGDVGRSIIPSNLIQLDDFAKELRDGDKSRYCGYGVLNVVENINSVIAENIEGRNVLDQVGIDEALINLDGTEKKTKLGANAILGVSIAACKAAACNLQIPLFQNLGGVSGRTIPNPVISVLKSKNFNRIFIVPTCEGFFTKKIRKCIEVNWQLKKANVDIDLEDKAALDIIIECLEECDCKNDFKIIIESKNLGNNSSFIKDYPIELILNNNLNTVLINPLKFGSVTETIDAIRMAKSSGYRVMTCSCDRETDDTFIADLSVGLNIRNIIIGDLNKYENVCKCNRLIRIEELMSES